GSLRIRSRTGARTPDARRCAPLRRAPYPPNASRAFSITMTQYDPSPPASRRHGFRVTRPRAAALDTEVAGAASAERDCMFAGAEAESRPKKPSSRGRCCTRHDGWKWTANVDPGFTAYHDAADRAATCNS